MKILGIRKQTLELVTTDNNELPDYRRSPLGKWEYRSGLSWEEVGEQEEIEAAYQAFKRAKKTGNA